MSCALRVLHSKERAGLQPRQPQTPQGRAILAQRHCPRRPEAVTGTGRVLLVQRRRGKAQGGTRVASEVAQDLNNLPLFSGKECVHDRSGIEQRRGRVVESR